MVGVMRPTVFRPIYLICRTCYIGVPLYVCGFVVLGAALQHHLGIVVVIVGWAIAQIAVLVNTVAVCSSSSFLAIYSFFLD